jgi:hypothetical protein
VFKNVILNAIEDPLKVLGCEMTGIAKHGCRGNE